MSLQGDQIKSALGISALVSFYGIASLAVWFLGPSLGMGWAWQIIIIALILLTWPFAILINHFRKKRAKKREEMSATEGTQQGVKAGTPPKRVYDELSRAAEEAVQWLRSTLIAGAKTNRAVYALPWFVVAGPPASGKTSLLLASGLDFHELPSQRRADHNIVRATRYCDWRVTDVGVFIDTAGRYQSDGPARDEWLALLDTIKKYRPDRPLDGFLITVDTKRILLSSETEIEQLAKILRARLDELIRLARTRFPVYLVFTHLDSVNGFSDVFRGGAANAGSEVFGATIQLEKSPGAHALFDVEFDHLYQSLSRRRLLLLQQSASAKTRLNIFDFPWRFRDLQSKLGLFTSMIFRPNPFSESPLLRGFYFTANVTTVANGDRPKLRIVSEPEGERPAAAVGEGYFINRFFGEVLLRDKDLASSFQASRNSPSRLRLYLLMAAVLLLLAFAVGATASFLGNHELLAEATERGTRVEAIRHADLGKDVTKKEPVAAREEMEAVEALRSTLADLDDYDRNSPPLRLRFGLYSGNAVNASLRAIYFDSIQQRYVKPAGAALEQDLQSFASGATVTSPANAGSSVPNADQSGGQNEEDLLGRNYDLLKAYMMLADRSKVDPAFLAGQLEMYWKKTAPSEMEQTSLRQLQFFASQAGSEDAPQFPVDAKLVVQVQRKLVAYPAFKRYYKQLISEINAKTKPVTVESIVKSGSDELVGTHTVPGSFTIDGYRNYIQAVFDSNSAEISKDDWVTAAAGAGAHGNDMAELKSLYWNQYSDHWRKFLRGASLREFKTPAEAGARLRELSSTDSPMAAILTTVARQTQLSAKPPASGLWHWIKSWFSSAESQDSGGDTPVEKEFRPLFEFVGAGDDKKGSNAVTQYRDELLHIGDRLENKSAEELAETSKALLAGKDEIGLQKAEKTADRLLSKTPAATDAAAFLKQPIDNTRALLYLGVRDQIEQEWTEVYTKAHQLEAGYPFGDGADASVSDLSQFLNPVNGKFSSFLSKLLVTSIEGTPGQWRRKPSSSFRISDELLKYLNDVGRLREALFQNPTSPQPQVTYQLTLQPESDTEITMDMYGTLVQTAGNQDQTTKSLLWPAPPGSLDVKITAIPKTTSQAEQPRTFSGEWALFRMFDAGAPQSGAPYKLSWRVGSVVVHATLKSLTANDPFDRRLFKDLHAPQAIHMK